MSQAAWLCWILSQSHSAIIAKGETEMSQPGIAVASKSEVCVSWNLQCCEMVPRLLPAIIPKCEIQAAVASSHEMHGEGKATGPQGLTQCPRWGPGHSAAFPEEVYL